MKKLLFAAALAITLIGVGHSTTTLADVQFNNDQPGKPVYHISNTGSDSGIAHRSDTGTQMKIENDGMGLIW